jgi:hypothetical protein
VVADPHTVQKLGLYGEEIDTCEAGVEIGIVVRRNQNIGGVASLDAVAAFPVCEEEPVSTEEKVKFVGFVITRVNQFIQPGKDFRAGGAAGSSGGRSVVGKVEDVLRRDLLCIDQPVVEIAPRLLCPWKRPRQILSLG